MTNQSLKLRENRVHKRSLNGELLCPGCGYLAVVVALVVAAVEVETMEGHNGPVLRVRLIALRLARLRLCSDCCTVFQWDNNFAGIPRMQ